jgi:hypothetical protein
MAARGISVASRLKVLTIGALAFFAAAVRPDSADSRSSRSRRARAFDCLRNGTRP